MKFKFKVQSFQTEASESIVKVFAGQPKQSVFKYRRDIGKRDAQTNALEQDAEFEMGYRNADIELTQEQLLENIRAVQTANNIKNSSAIEEGLGLVSLDVEMETEVRVIIVTGCSNTLAVRVSETFIKNFT